jgi:hypothetical protein
MAGTITGTVNYELFVGAGTFMITWFLKCFADGDEADSGVSREEFWERRAAEITPGADGEVSGTPPAVMNTFLKRLTGEPWLTRFFIGSSPRSCRRRSTLPPSPKLLINWPVSALIS